MIPPTSRALFRPKQCRDQISDRDSELDALIATKQPKKYDEAVALLGDLRDVCARGGRQAEAATRIARLREEHTKKPSLIERFRKAGLTI